MAQGSSEEKTPGLTVDDVAGSLAARQALGPDAEEAVIQAFLDRTGKAIDERVAERLAAQQTPHGRSPYAQQMQQVPNPLGVPMGMHIPPMQPQPAPKPDRTPFALAMASLVAGIPLTGIASQFGNNGVGWGFEALIAVIIVWVGLAVINVSYNRRQK